MGFMEDMRRWERDINMREQTAQLQEQTRLMYEAQFEAEWAAKEAQEAQDRAENLRLFQQKLSELEKYAAERNLVRVEVLPKLGGNLGQYTNDIIQETLKQFKEFCKQLENEDRYLDGDKYACGIRRTIKLGDLNGIAKTHKEPFVVVPESAGFFYILPMDIIGERTGDGYEGKDVELPLLSQILFLKPDELPAMAQMLVRAKNAADITAKTIAESSELKDIEEKIKNIPEKTESFIGKTLLVLAAAILVWFLYNLTSTMIDYGFDGDVIAVMILSIMSGLEKQKLGAAIVIIILISLFIAKTSVREKNEKLKDALLKQKKETISRIISESVSSAIPSDKQSLPPAA